MHGYEKCRYNLTRLCHQVSLDVIIHLLIFCILKNNMVVCLEIHVCSLL